MRALCQPKFEMNPCPMGAKTNWPKDEAAVAMPKMRPRFSCGTLRPNATMTMEKEELAMPTPTMTPAVRFSRVPVGEITMSASPAA